MAMPISKLAARFAQAVTQEEREAARLKVEAAAAQAAHAARMELVAAARGELLDELAAFAKGVPGVSARRRKDGAVTLTHTGRSVVFAPVEQHIHVTYDDAFEGEHIGGALADGETEVAWTLFHGALQVPLFDAGFEALCVEGLALPAPEGYVPLQQPGAAPAAAPADEPEDAFEAQDDDDLPADHDVKSVLAARRRERWAKARARGKTKVIGTNASPWEMRPSNPGVPAAPPAAKPIERDASAYDVRPVHNEAAEAPKKRAAQSEASVGSSVKPYKSILG